jgi:hypothetical protein
MSMRFSALAWSLSNTALVAPPPRAAFCAARGSREVSQFAVCSSEVVRGDQGDEILERFRDEGGSRDSGEVPPREGAAGLVVSQVLTLYTTPIVYLYVEKIRVSVNRRRGHTVADEVVPSGPPADGGMPARNV